MFFNVRSLLNLLIGLLDQFFVPTFIVHDGMMTIKQIHKSDKDMLYSTLKIGFFDQIFLVEGETTCKKSFI